MVTEPNYSKLRRFVWSIYAIRLEWEDKDMKQGRQTII